MKVSEIKKMYKLNNFAYNNTGTKKKHDKNKEETFEEVLDKETNKLKEKTLDEVIKSKTLDNKTIHLEDDTETR